MNGAAETACWAFTGQRRMHGVLDELDRRAPGLGTLVRRTAATGVAVTRFEIRKRAMKASASSVCARQCWSVQVCHGSRRYSRITERKQIEELIGRAERLQAVAELGASLAHEIKNPLASIRSAVEQLAGRAE